MDRHATDFGNAVARESLNRLLERADTTLELMTLRFAMPKQRLCIEQLPSGILFLCLAMCQERLSPLQAFRKPATLSLGVIESLAEMPFALLLSLDHALGVGELCFELLHAAEWGRCWGFRVHLAPVLGKVQGLL